MRRFAAKVLFLALAVLMLTSAKTCSAVAQLSAEAPYYPLGYGIRVDDPAARIDVTILPGRNYYALPPPDKRSPARPCYWGKAGFPDHRVAGQDAFSVYLARVKGLGPVIPMPPCDAAWRPVDVFRLIAYVFGGGPAPVPADVTGDGVVDGRDIRRLQACVYAGGLGDAMLAPTGKLYSDDAIASFNPDRFPRNGYARIAAVLIPFGPCDGPPPISSARTVTDVLRGKGFEAGDWLAVEYNAGAYSSEFEHPIFRRGDGTTIEPVLNFYWNY